MKAKSAEPLVFCLSVALLSFLYQSVVFGKWHVFEACSLAAELFFTFTFKVTIAPI